LIPNTSDVSLIKLAAYRFRKREIFVPK
jgi:hypothetical protein